MEKPNLLRVGAEIRVWWETGNPDNMARILEILPYRGHFTEHFDCVLKLPAPRTYRGWVEMAYRSSDFAYDGRAS